MKVTVESPLYVHWADKQVAECIMRMNEEEEEGTRSPRLSLLLAYSTAPPPIGVFRVRVK